MPRAKKTKTRSAIDIAADLDAETPTGKAAIEMARLILAEGTVEARREARQWIRVALAADQQMRDAQVAELQKRFLSRDARARQLDEFDASFHASATKD